MNVVTRRRKPSGCYRKDEAGPLRPAADRFSFVYEVLMSKKIARNSICLCGSGLKYKRCCGKNEGLKPTSMRFIGDDRVLRTDFEKKVYEELGNYPDDYINPITTITDVLYVLIDESNIGDYYAVSGIVVLKSEIERNIKVKSELRELVDKYNIDCVHFTEIFGRKKVLGDRKSAFIKEYINIVKSLDLKAFTVCLNESEIKSWLQLDSITKEQCYNALTWKLMFNILIYATDKYGINLIIEMWRESDNITNEKRILHQVNVKGAIKDFPFANISIYRHYILFYKEEILFSSISDFIAYLTIGLYPKLKAGVSLKDLANDYYDLLMIYNEIFGDTIGMKSIEFEQVLSIVREREKFRKSSG